MGHASKIGALGHPTSILGPPCLLYSLVLLIILKHCLLFFLLSDLTFSIMLCNSLTMFHVYCLPPISYKISSMKAEFFGSVMNVKYTQQCLTP